MTQGQMPIQPGDRAPDFVVPSVNDDRTISLADYRGKTPVLLGLFRGLYCPFCRRSMAQMAATSERLQSIGVDSLAFVSMDGLYRAVGEARRDPVNPRFCDACFTGDYPIALDDLDDPEERQLSLLRESA